MKIGIAQLRSVKGDVVVNIKKHQMLIEIAVFENADALFFPELSITGYEPELARELATTSDDNRFDIFQKISDTNFITIGIGVPTKTKTGTGIRISMLIFQSGKTRQTYSKQQLHSDEFPYFEEGDKQLILEVGNKKIAPAICYESLQVNHSGNANKLGADIYLASVAKPETGLVKAMAHYPEIAKKYRMPVLMSNCVGYCNNFLSVGQSAVWTNQGKLVKQLDEKDEGILIFDTETEEVVKWIK